MSFLRHRILWEKFFKLTLEIKDKTNYLFIRITFTFAIGIGGGRTDEGT